MAADGRLHLAGRCKLLQARTALGPERISPQLVSVRVGLRRLVWARGRALTEGCFAGSLIIGDSVSIGYTPYVVAALSSTCLVQHGPWDVSDGAAARGRRALAFLLCRRCRLPGCDG